MMITIAEARAFARDYESSDEEMESMIAVAQAMIEDGVKANVDPNLPQAKLLCKLYVADMTDNRTLTAAEQNSRRQMVSSLTAQVRMSKGLEEKA